MWGFELNANQNLICHDLRLLTYGLIFINLVIERERP